MRSFLLLIALLLGLGAIGCGSTEPPTNIGPLNIPFSLVIPGNRPAADYYAVSGVSVRIVATKVGDSIVEMPQTLFYAQFAAAPGAELPDTVTLNHTPLDRHLDTDTLRLAAAAPNILADNTWGLIDANNSETTFLVPKIDIIDTVSPFDERSSVRSDTSLELGWKRPTLISSAMHIRWTTSNHTYEQVMPDSFGAYTIPASEMEKLRGRGKVLLTRYYYLPRKYKSRDILLIRIAQRSFEIDVL